LNKLMRTLLWVAGLVFVAYLVSQGPLARTNQTKPLAYNDLINKVKAGQVQSIKIERDTARGQLQGGGEFTANLPTDITSQGELTKVLLDKNVTIEYPKPWFNENTQNILVTIIVPLAAIAILWVLFWRQAQSTGNQALSFGRSRAKRLTDNVPKVTFDDVAGVEEAKAELQEVVEFLRNPKKFQSLGAKIPKGVLLLGPPGCGKTLLARAIAGEAGVPFFHISGSDFVEMFVGVGASRVRDLFDTAKANKPSLIFIDEIDAVGRQRGAGLGGGHDEREQTLNQLLVEMDGFDPNAGVILIAATNRPDVLDPALLRPGRFDRRVVVDNPDVNGRRKILDVHTKGKPIADDVDQDRLARRTPGFTGADLANLVNEAALKAARENKTQIFAVDFEASIDRVIAGPERRSRVISEKEKRVVAYHEVGHAIVLELLEHADPVHKVTILPRGLSLGSTMQLPMDDRYLWSRSQLLDNITGFLGGRVAEAMIFNEITSGASNDLERASDLARRMVTELGMSDRLGPITLGRRHGNPFLGRDLMEDRNYSEDVAKAIDEEVKSIMDDGYGRARGILDENRDAMERVVAVLLERETIEREEFLALMRGEPLPEEPATLPEPPAPRAPANEKEKPHAPGAQALKPRPNPA